MLSRFAVLLAFALATPLAAQELKIVQIPDSVKEGDLVTLTIDFPEGYAADFTPIFEENFQVFDVTKTEEIDADDDGETELKTTIVGAGCSFSAGCKGARDIVVIATSFRVVGKSVVRKTIRHIVKVERHAPDVPRDPPPREPPRRDDPDERSPDLPDDPGTPIGAVEPSPEEEKNAALLEVFESINSRFETIDQRLDDLAEKLKTSTPAPAVAPPKIVDESQAPPAVVRSTPVVSSTSSTAVDVRPGHWSVGPDWSPSKAQTISHLRSAHYTENVRKREPLESLSLETLLTLHDDSHEGRETRFASSTTTYATSTYVEPVVNSAPVVMRASPCPGGVCPTSTSRSVSRGGYGPLGLIRWGR